MMDPKKMGKQMLDFYKTSFDNSYNAMMMLQEQMDRLGSHVLWTECQSARRGQKRPDRVDQILQEELRRFQESGGRRFPKAGI